MHLDSFVIVLHSVQDPDVHQPIALCDNYVDALFVSESMNSGLTGSGSDTTVHYINNGRYFDDYNDYEKKVK